MKFIIQDDWERHKNRQSFLYIHKGKNGNEHWWIRNKSQATVFDTKMAIDALGKEAIKIIPAPFPGKKGV